LFGYFFSGCSVTNVSKNTTPPLNTTHPIQTKEPAISIQPTPSPVDNASPKLSRDEALKRVWGLYPRPIPDINLGETKNIDVMFCGVSPYTITYDITAMEVEPNLLGLTIAEDWNVVLNDERVVLTNFILLLQIKQNL